ncbi:MAG: hypothetical protein IGS38_18635 [Synechococcales cyanobacterium M58_A2018_015]|nr:hypothetical protein [Synechococcales cyanobacterium M58_A2018_015]
MKDLAKAKKTDESDEPEFQALPVDYRSWSAIQKQDFLWEKRILTSQYRALPVLKKIDIVGLFLTSLRTKMDYQSDEAPTNWKKAIHAHGSVAKIRFIPTANTPFTGLFQGADYGLLRLSVTGDPAARGFAPGLAIKWFIDGRPSANVSALVSLVGQGDNYNFFAHEFSNIVPVVNQLGPKLINLIFSRTSRHPTKLDLQNLSQFQQTGEVEAHPHHPLQLFLVPTPEVQFPASPPHDFRTDLATIPAGTTLFVVYGVDFQEHSSEQFANLRQSAQQIGTIETTSPFVASSYGDSRLFFRHQRFKNQ